MFQHTAARRRLHPDLFGVFVLFCFNTQPPEGGCAGICIVEFITRGFNTQPPEGGCCGHGGHIRPLERFQHTAARRRLDLHSNVIFQNVVSTHSRPKAAAKDETPYLVKTNEFQHTAARRRLAS